MPGTSRMIISDEKAVYHVMPRTALDRYPLQDVEKGETLVNCLAYIDLNPVRAGLVDRPEEYRWNSLEYRIQTENKDRFLSTDFVIDKSTLGINGSKSKSRDTTSNYGRVNLLL